ncbi:MAG: hypothetical protein FWD82_10795 [Defluviitaleaceae bacterium]|nr:hypothetical protein [Defluviitaleaceae bacterium]
MVFHYLWYKLYRAALRSFEVEWAAIWYSSITFGALIQFNIMFLSGLLAKLDILPAIYPNSKLTLYINFIFLALSYVYFRFKSKTIIGKYSQESDKQKRKGNENLVIYVIITLFVGVVGSFYKPGYLPNIWQ